MVAKAVKRLLAGKAPLLALLALLGVSLVLLNLATHHAGSFDRIYVALLVTNISAILILLGLITRHALRLARQYRAGAPGSRLTLRLVLMFTVLSVAPVLAVYYFSFDFLQRGIDSWFDVEVEKALGEALDLSRASLGLRMRELMDQTRSMAKELEQVPPGVAAITLNDLRARSTASELALYAPGGRIVAASMANADQLVPQPLDSGVAAKARAGKDAVGLIPIAGQGLFIRAVARVPRSDPTVEPLVLQALYPVAAHINTLAEHVQAAVGRYRELAYLRTPLKYTFLLTLSLVLLLSVLTAVLAALYASRRLVQPISDLAEGTRAVAAGDYAKRLPLPGRDELGFLVRSFNEMTRRISMAQKEARRSQQVAEEQRTYLEAVLANLSSGVLTLDTDLRLRTANTAASQMLGVDLAAYRDQPLIHVVDDHTQLQFLVDAIAPHLESGEGDWEEEVTLFGPGGRRVFIWRGSNLGPGEAGAPGGHVLVFDDITDLMQAQRDAAWGEVARRLAHEIKNPLTPIQLAAERLRQKLLARLDPDAAAILDRSTGTIVQQVEHLKEMVKAFSDYARMPSLRLGRVDLNRLVREVVELYTEESQGIRFATRLESGLPAIEADEGRLRQLLHNLFKNALEAVDYAPKAPIEVSTRCMQEANCHFVELQVRDSGPGIPEDMLGQLFEPYVTTKPRGTGLGLAIVKKIVEEHGGVLWAENQRRGGACLTVRLPVSRSRTVAAPQAQGQDHAA